MAKRLWKRRFDLGATGLFPICYQAFELGDKRMTAKEKTIFKLHWSSIIEWFIVVFSLFSKAILFSNWNGQRNIHHLFTIFIYYFHLLVCESTVIKSVIVEIGNYSSLNARPPEPLSFATNFIHAALIHRICLKQFDMKLLHFWQLKA